MGNDLIYNGENKNYFEIIVLARKIVQYQSTVYQKMQNCNILGVMFSKKTLFCQYFQEVITI